MCFELKGWWKGSQKSKGIYKSTKANTSKVSLELGSGEMTTGKQKELEKENKEWRNYAEREVRDWFLKYLRRRLRLMKQFTVLVFLCGSYG